MSPRLPRPSTSERRISFTSVLRAGTRRPVAVLARRRGARIDRPLVLLVRSLVPLRRCLGCALEVTLTSWAPIAWRASALCGDAPRVRQQCHLAGDLDRTGDLTLLLHVVAAHPAVADLGSVAHEPREQVDVLVVDVLHLLGDEVTRLLLVFSLDGVLGRPGAVLLARHQWFSFGR